MINVTVVNAHVLFCLVNEPIPLSDFRKLMVRIYLRKSPISNSKKAGRPLLNKSANKCVLSEDRKDETGDYLQRIDGGKQRKYAICKINARNECGKCNVGLHVESMAT